MARRTPAGRAQISAKISFLVNEGLSQKAAVGKALGMADSGDLGPEAKVAARPRRARTMHYSRHGMDLYTPCELTGDRPAKY